MVDFSLFLNATRFELLLCVYINMVPNGGKGGGGGKELRGHVSTQSSHMQNSFRTCLEMGRVLFFTRLNDIGMLSF